MLRSLEKIPTLHVEIFFAPRLTSYDHPTDPPAIIVNCSCYENHVKEIGEGAATSGYNCQRQTPKGRWQY